MRSIAAIFAVVVLSLTTAVPAFAQVVDLNKAQRDKINENTVFIAGGSLGATYNSLANDIGIVTSDDALRVISVTTSTGVQNVRDLVYLRSIDLAFTNVRVLNGFAASGELGPDLKRQIVYIAPLTTEEAHVLVQPEINSLDRNRASVGVARRQRSEHRLAQLRRATLRPAKRRVLLR